MNSVSFASALRKPLRRFAVDQDGVSAVEFALVLPLMLTLYLGGVEVSQAVSADRKTMLAAHSVGDLVSRVSCVTSSDLTNVMNAAKEVVYPFDSGKLQVAVTRVDIDANGTATVPAAAQGGFSATLNGATPRSGDVTSYIPSALRAQAGSLIWAETAYTYTPTIGYVITGALTLKEQIYLRPRQSNAVTYTTGVCPAS